MRRIAFIAVTAVVLMFGGNNVFAQGKYGADSAECIKYLSYYKEYFKSKNYDAALPNWRKAYKLCPPTANQTMLIDGTTLIRRMPPMPSTATHWWIPLSISTRFVLSITANTRLQLSTTWPSTWPTITRALLHSFTPVLPR